MGLVQSFLLWGFCFTSRGEEEIESARKSQKCRVLLTGEVMSTNTLLCMTSKSVIPVTPSRFGGMFFSHQMNEPRFPGQSTIVTGSNNLTRLRASPLSRIRFLGLSSAPRSQANIYFYSFSQGRQKAFSESCPMKTWPQIKNWPQSKEGFAERKFRILLRGVRLSLKCTSHQFLMIDHQVMTGPIAGLNGAIRDAGYNERRRH